MAVPDFQSFMFPLLKAVSDGKEYNLSEVVDKLAEQFQLSNEDKKELLPSGRKTRVDDRAGWAQTYLRKAGLLERTGRGKFRVTERGIDVLERNPEKINVKFLKQFPEFVEFQNLSRRSAKPDAEAENEILDETPEETMGYGGSRKDAGQAVGQSGDDGVDGIIKEDRLGLDVVYIQAKRWEGTVGRPVVQAFAGSLDGQRARKGVLITTSQFSQDARDYVSRIEKKIILIDGEQLAQLMIDHGIGVAEVATYTVKKMDLDYFGEE